MRSSVNLGSVAGDFVRRVSAGPDVVWSDPDCFDGSGTSYTLYAMAGGVQPIGLDGSASPAVSAGVVVVAVDAVGQVIVIAVSVSATLTAAGAGGGGTSGTVTRLSSGP